MRNYLADLAFVRAERAVVRAENARTMKSRYFWLGRSRWWGDVECWLVGLGTWSEIRASRFRRSRQSQPFAPMPIIEGPRS